MQRTPSLIKARLDRGKADACFGVFGLLVSGCPLLGVFGFADVSVIVGENLPWLLLSLVPVDR